MIVGVGERGGFVAGLCVLSSVFSAFVFCSFVHSFVRSSVVRSHTCCIHVFNEDLQSEKEPNTYIYRMVPNIDPSSPSSSIVPLRPNRHRSLRRTAYIPTPISIGTNRSVRSRRKARVSPSCSSVLGVLPMPIAVAPPDVDLGPKLADARILPGAEGNPRPILHDQLPLTG